MALRDQPYIPLYVQDFLSDEKLRECSAQAVGVYIMVICVMHKSKEYGKILLSQNLSSISDFARKLKYQLPFDVDVIDAALTELVEKEVLHIEDSCLYQKRMVKDCELSDKRASAGKKGNDTRYKNNDICDSKTSHKTLANSEYENESEYEYENDIDIENENVIDIKKVNIQEKRFEEFWKLYPKKVGKGAARKSWSKIKPTEELFNKIITALEAAKKTEQWNRDHGQYIPHPSTWLNQERWEDDYTPAPQGHSDRVRKVDDWV